MNAATAEKMEKIIRGKGREKFFLILVTVWNQKIGSIFNICHFSCMYAGMKLLLKI